MRYWGIPCEEMTLDADAVSTDERRHAHPLTSRALAQLAQLACADSHSDPFKASIARNLWRATGLWLGVGACHLGSLYHSKACDAPKFMFASRHVASNENSVGEG